MKITTQTQALAELERIGQQISGLLDRYASAGNGLVRRAEIAEAMARAFAERATVYGDIPTLFRGRNPQRPAAQLVTRMALESAALALTDTKTWSTAAQSARAEARRIEEQAGVVFADDGLEYVEGRGWVRKSAASAQQENDQ